MTASAKIASQTKLPPSPEIKSIPHHFDHDLLTLDRDTADSRRLRSIARYESFHPQALACSPPIHHLTTDAGVPSASSKLAAVEKTSLGAVAGSDGVALFRVSKPHVPLMMLSYASSHTTTTTSLSFQPENSKYLFLASARGSGVLVWDVSGHSLSPLWGRVGVEHAGNTPDAPPSNVTSLSWTATSSPWLAATTASSACLWDLRQSAFRPSLRFAVNSITGSPYLQIACSRIECAILDATGTVRVYDTRVTDRRTGNSTVCQFDACKHAGVGLSFFKENRWVTWGLDAPNADAVVKIWSCSLEEAADNATAGVPEDYWFMGGSPDRPKTIKSISAATSKSNAPEYRCRMIAQCTTRNLACARVCPSPVVDSIVTVGLDPQDNSSEACWRAELWKLKSLSSNDSSDEYRLERITAFEGTSDASVRSLMGQDSRLQSLRASELAISSYTGTVAPHSRDGPSGNSGLMLCCLTENGFVTTHAIPEALPNNQENNRKDSGDLLAGSSHSHTREIASLTAPTKLFPIEPEIAINDAARTWGAPKELFWGRSLSKRRPSVSGLLDTATESSGHPISAGSRGVEEGLMPFDMDVPVAYSMTGAGVAGLPNAGMNELVSPSALSGIASIDDSEQVDNVIRDAAAFMERIETERIPCPRLCGATFSSGVGGMVAFHNGDVTKMWHWFERSDTARLAAVPGLIGEPSLNGPKRPKSPVFLGVEEESSGLQKLTSNCPRTLKDLTDMMGAAKEAQWGEQDHSEHSSTGFPALGENFFEDDSDASSDLGDEQSDDLPGVYDSKESIGDQRAVTEPSTQNHDTLDATDTQGASDNVYSPATVGPSSDMLAPIVKVSREYDRIALNNQNIQFAERWQLGDLYVNSEISRPSPHVTTPPKQHNRLTKSDGALDISIDSMLGTGESPTRQVLPSYRSLLPSSPGPKIIPQQKISPTVLREPVHSDDERGVHGGEYSVRPNMQESMVFLRKLFTHQQQDGGTFRNMRTPPDSPMLSKPSISGQMLSLSPDFGGRKNLKGSSDSADQMQLGVYVLRAEKPSARSQDDELMKIRDLCLHNAEVCESLGDQEKRGVWDLIAKTVQSRIKHSGQGFDGWGGPGGGALGAGLVSNFLRYYESLGDVQMLSTLVCVLSSKRQNAANGKKKDWLLVPSDHEGRYDMYIRRYADLLYGWGLLTRRAELNKHLTREIAPIESGVVDSTEGPSDGQSKPGIAMVFKCPRCAGNSEFGANYCRSCHDFAFRCAICDNAVRGLFTVCDSCGHGGHVNHMKDWFSLHEDCPSGCGCNCKFAASASFQRETELMAQAAPNAAPLAQTAQPASYVAS